VTTPATLPPPGLADDRVVGTGTLAGDPQSGIRKATSDAALMTVATYGAQVLTFVAGVIQKAILGPTLVGAWALIQTAWTFFSIAPLGAHHGAARQIPMHRGRGDYAAAEATAGSASTFSLGMITLLGSLVAVVAIVFGGGHSEQLRFGLVLLGVTAPLRHLTDIHEVIIQGVKRFDIEALTVVVQAIIALTLQTLAVKAFGFYGLFLGLVAMNLASFALWLRLGVITPQRPAFRLGIHRPALRETIRFGAPILVYAQVWLLFQAVDSLIVAGALDLRQLGFYALAVSVTTYVLYLPKSIGAALFPRMAERFARTGDIDSIQHYAADVQRLLAYIAVPLAIAVGFFTFPVLILHALPAFAPAIDVVQIMIGASFFMALMNMPIKVLMTAGYRWSLTSIMLVCLALNAGLNVLAVGPLHWGLKGAAAATAISYMVTWGVTTAYSLSRSMPARKVALHLGEILVVFGWTYGAMHGIESLLGPTQSNIVSDIALTTAKLTLFLLALTPWLWLAERRLGGITMLRGVATSALRRLPGRS
jgi:O-antigen/teichoic acid export membrane protein